MMGDAESNVRSSSLSVPAGGAVERYERSRIERAFWRAREMRRGNESKVGENERRRLVRQMRCRQACFSCSSNAMSVVLPQSLRLSPLDSVEGDTFLG